ncbi:MAG: DUF3108 domain-containing protein [Bacteroidales bacterium]|nr:DUF3108 domain-containing protein [Bacteroidales bacterium]MDD4383773.1 DUF3108 domain-containing protein [Bacteroidales bacterium]
MSRSPYIIVALLLLSSFVFGQDCSPKTINFKSGERITYRAVYNWGFIWINAGDVEFAVNDTFYLDNPALHLKSTGWSLKQYDWFFKVRDRFESIVNPNTIQPYWFERDTHEGGTDTYNRYVFRHTDSALDIISQTTSRPFKKEILPLKPCTFDVLSAIYYCRTIDFNRYSKGDKIPITMAIDNEVFDLYLRYLGKERLQTRSGEVFNTIRFKAMLVEGTIFKGGEDLDVWVTDDKNRVPILIEAKILVGSVKAVLTGMEGLLYPVESKVVSIKPR